MDSLVEFSIPVSGLGNGLHQFQFRIDSQFFSCFEESPIEDGDINVLLDFDKRPDMYVLQFDFEGTVKTDCDRCLASIGLPVSGSEQLLVKFSLDEEDEEADVIYISPETKKFNVSRFIYEFIILAMPMIKVYHCETETPRPCNPEMLEYLSSGQEKEDPENKEDNPIWEELKKLTRDND